MKTVRLIAVSVIFAAIFAVSAFAQTPTTTGDKIGLVAWDAFADPAKGIKKYAAALDALEKEFAPLNTELQGMGTKYQALQTEYTNLQKQVQEGKVPVAPGAIQTKADEIGKMERDIKFKQEDAKARYQSRYNVTIGPIQNDILKAMNDYAAQKGYAVILDGGKLEESGLLLGFAPKANVTEDFIVFYNQRPPTTATTTVPVKK
jgi:Skp family chaperone for outer membrane proteins